MSTGVDNLASTLLVYCLSRQATVWLGALWGIVVWLCMFAVVLLRVAHFLSRGGGGLGAMILHLVFGLVFGIGFLFF